MLKLNSHIMLYINRSVTYIHKSNGAALLKRLNKENKQLFGRLLLTEKQRLEINKATEKTFHDVSKIHKLPKKIPKVVSVKPDVVPKLLKTAEDIQPDTTHKNTQRISKKQFIGAKKIVEQNEFKYFKDLTDENEKLNFKKLEEELSKVVKNDKLIIPPSVVKNITSFPLLNTNENKECKITVDNKYLLPSVTKILSDSMSESSKAALQRWKNNLISKLGEEGFLAFQKEQLSQGSQFHELVQNYLSGQQVTASPDLEGCWKSISKEVLGRVGAVEATEKKVFHPWLLYKGVVDCIAHFDGIPVVIEWKKSEKQKPKIKDTYDAPLQLTAYMSALSFDPQFNYQIQGGVVVVAYTDGSPASVYPLKLTECTVYWTAWLKRLQLYWQIQHENLNNQ